MSLVNLDSFGANGSTPNNFRNFFPNPIVLPPNSQVALVNIKLNTNRKIVITRYNNLLYFRIGNFDPTNVESSDPLRKECDKTN